MAHFEYHNATKTVVDEMRNVTVHIIERVCAELGASEKAPSMIEKYVGESIRIKKFKDKNHPKKPKSGYMIYCDKNREEVKKKTPNMSFTDTIKKIAKQWNELTPEEKAKYMVLSEEDRGRYARELEQYNSEIYKSNVV